MMVWLVVIAFLAGFPSAWAWGKYLRAVQNDLAGISAWWDTVIGLLGTVLALTLWRLSNDNPVVLVSYVLGNGLGTYVVVQHNARKK